MSEAVPSIMASIVGCGAAKQQLKKTLYHKVSVGQEKCVNLNAPNYDLQFGFRQQYSTSHTLINITENIRKAPDDGNIACGVYIDLYKAFGTLDHQILLVKLNHHGIRGVSNEWFKSYLSNLNQYVSINAYESSLAVINCGVPQGSVVGALLFLLYINDLNQAVKVPHFADDTNLICHCNWIKKLNKLVNTDLKHLVGWLSVNKISLNVKKLK